MTAKITIVSPMHNESACASEFIRRVTAVMDEQFPNYECLIVDDGSTDDTATIVREHLPKHPNVRLISLARNSGQWAATYAGISESTGDYVVIMDSDLQNLPEEIPCLVTVAIDGQYALVSGKRNRTDSVLLRQLPSRIANAILRWVTQCPSKDMGGFKCIQGELARKLHIRAGQHRFLPILIWQQGGSVVDVPVSFPPRFAGTSHYGLSRIIDVFFDILLFWLQTRCKNRPFYLFGRISAYLTLLSLSAIGWTIYQKLWLGIHMGTRPLFLGGLIGLVLSTLFLTMGFILEITSTIQHKVCQEKPYFIRSIESGESESSN